MGCKNIFCVKHYIKHRQQLSVDFDSDVIRTHDELLQQIHQALTPKESFSDLFFQSINGKKTTIEKIRTAAEEVRHELNQLIDSERNILTHQFESLTNKVRRRRDEEDFDENNIEHLRQQIDHLRQSFEELNRRNKNKLIVVENDQID